MSTTQECQEDTYYLEDTYYFNNVVNIKLTEHRRIHKIFHITDIENLLETDNLETIMLLFNLMNQSNNNMMSLSDIHKLYNI